MKLTSMTDFVLEQMKEVTLDGTGVVCARIGNYANFLKQNLNLGMFVPTDEAGNVLKEPERWKDYLLAPESFDGNKEWYELYAYQQAKERVLFEGFELVNENYHIFVQSDKLDIRFSKKDKSIDSFRFKYIEDLTSRNLTLTETALKQIGL